MSHLYNFYGIKVFTLQSRNFNTIKIMNTNTIKILFYLTTGLISLFYLQGVYLYLSGHENIINALNTLGFPLWLIPSLGVAKFLGVVALWLPIIPKWLREWAYAGIFFNALLAFGAHIAINDFDIAPLIVLLLLISSRFLLFKQETQIAKP